MDGATSPNQTTSTPNLTFHEPTGSITPHILLYVVQFIFLASPPFRGRNSLVTGIVFVLAIQAQLKPHFTNNVGLAQPFTIAWSYYFSTLEKFLFSGEQGPEGTFWRIDQPAREALSFRGFSFAKWKWASMMMLNQRGIRWNHQVKNVSEIRRREKFTFLLWQAWEFIKCMLVADLLFQLSTRLFFTSPNGQIGILNSKYLTLRHPDWRWSFVKAFVFGATPYFMVSMQYAQISFLAVLLGLSKPEDWPPLFGPIKDVTTVREFWGKFWHQTLRRMLTTYTRVFVDSLGIKHGTNMSSYTQLWLAFLFSGTFHALSQLTLPSPINITISERTTGFLLFFVWQAAAITFEDFVQWLWKQAGGSTTGSSRLRTLLGYIWVTCSMWYSLPMVGDTFLRTRLGVETFLPFTIVGSWMKYIPVP